MACTETPTPPASHFAFVQAIFGAAEAERLSEAPNTPVSPGPSLAPLANRRRDPPPAFCLTRVPALPSITLPALDRQLFRRGFARRDDTPQGDGMKRFAIVGLALAALAATGLPGRADDKGDKIVTSPLDFKAKSLDGKEVDLAKYRGKVVLVVNVASKCGFTPQYAGLEALYQKYKDRGLVIVGVPANNFMQQEPGTDAEIKTFCTNKYNVTFPMMAKVSVLGDDKDPLYVYLTSKSTNPQFAGDIKWNFTKFLFDRSGKPIARFEPNVTPDSPEVTAAIEAALAH
jgi:glutathione peroxidase